MAPAIKEKFYSWDVVGIHGTNAIDACDRENRYHEINLILKTMDDINNIMNGVNERISRLHSDLTKSTLTQTKRGDLSVTIPWTIAEALKLIPGSEVQFEIVNNEIVLKPQERTEYTLEELLEGVTPELIHGELDWGNPVGNEEW